MILTENQNVFNRPKERSRRLETIGAAADLKISSAVLKVRQFAKQRSQGQQVGLDRADSEGGDTQEQSLNEILGHRPAYANVHLTKQIVTASMTGRYFSDLFCSSARPKPAAKNPISIIINPVPTVVLK